MNYSQFLHMVPEVALTAVLIITFIADFFSVRRPVMVENSEVAVLPDGRLRSWFNPLVVALLIICLVVTAFQTGTVEVFGGMYYSNASAGIIKTILALGALIVVIQSKEWLSRPDTAFKEGEFYILVVSTLLGMYMMVSANHFLLFFLGIEMASVPMACLVAMDKYRHHSAEAGAKFILVSVFSTGVMIYGISFVYGAVGGLYFDDVAVRITTSPLTILGMVFFFSGLAFKNSLVPFHFWTADSYEGAPTTVTGYLSVVSKGAAAFALCVILMKVFGPLVDYWRYMLYIIVVLTITVANLFAIRQSDLKRFMAYSSISQAGYIVMAIFGNSAMSIAAVSYYILIYIVANLAVFTVISSVEEKTGGRTDMDVFNGLYQTNPKMSVLMMVALFSLGGIPPFAGMFSKFFVFMASVNGLSVTTTSGAMAYGVMLIALLNTITSIYYYLLIVKAMFIKKNENPVGKFKMHVNTKIALTLCTAGILCFGIFSCFYHWIAGGAGM